MGQGDSGPAACNANYREHVRGRLAAQQYLWQAASRRRTHYTASRPSGYPPCVPRIDVSMSLDEVMSLLRSQKTGALATLGKDGFPHQAAMWFVTEPRHVLMWTYRRSQKAVNLGRDRRASFMVEEGETYDSLRGALVQGEVELVDDVQR